MKAVAAVTFVEEFFGVMPMGALGGDVGGLAALGVAITSGLLSHAHILSEASESVGERVRHPE